MNLLDAQAAIAYGADAVGFVFAGSSKRKISLDTAAVITYNLPKDIFKVGVFANQKIEMIKDVLDRCKIDIIQLHGDETPEFCNNFSGYKIIKAFRVKDNTSLKNAQRYNNADAYLLDAFTSESLGGTGKTFEWTIAKEFVKDSSKPVILSGGLTPHNIIEAITTVKPYAVDVSSGVESAPGEKDHKLLREFIEKARVCLG